MKAIYHTMNCFNVDVTKKCLIGECWVPHKDVGKMKNALDEGSVSIKQSVDLTLIIIVFEKLMINI
jgi:V-type H+-transporting ATPase subunit a